MDPAPALVEGQGLRIAVEGCGHGTLDAIYAAVQKACEVRGWDGVDLLIIGGDFQAVRNASDLTVMSCPVKYREIGDFHKYYSGSAKAPYLTIFVGGNHEASSHLWELLYGGWVAPDIYYMGAANVVRVGGVRIAGMSGIWKGRDYNKHHHERLPYNHDDVKTIYHVREIDIRKLLQLKSQVDICISHDWPRAIENHGDSRALFRLKPDFEQESKEGTLGNQAATYVMDRLRPPYWFAAHMHCKFAATKTYEDIIKVDAASLPSSAKADHYNPPSRTAEDPVIAAAHNADEIDLDMDDEETVPPPKPAATNGSLSTTINQDEIDLDGGENVSATTTVPSSVPSNLRAQLPAAFSAPSAQSSRQVPGQPTPREVTNKTVRFLALDKCLPSRKFLQLLEVNPHAKTNSELPVHQSISRPKPKFEYDPEWLAITRVFAPSIVLGNKQAPLTKDLGEAHYRPLIEKEQNWVNEHIVKADKLEIPENFVITAPIFQVGMPELVNDGPVEYSNPQMQQYCDLVGIENQFFATQEWRDERMSLGPAPEEERRDGGFGRGRGRGGRGDRGGGRGGGRGRGRGGGRGRGRGW
ncbi:Lariat debranching enzyme [Lachnellula occidentalis]|uniref:Lariat debranching enzyme n=1 Tax=Lachnellula occidentalis TaxID=215460 RepID=A0A8H8S876_9HELO|nr:Lariat debranching enzyme [Lachnellula occidentalis]